MEIERKWLIKQLPNLSSFKRVESERYFVFIGHGVEARVQKINDKFEFERKVETSSLSRDEIRFDITEAEFEFYKSISGKSILRDSYEFSKSPNISIKIYHGDYEGLMRVEVEFNSEDDAKQFTPFDWFGKEITNSELGRDKNLIGLNEKDFNNILAKIRSVNNN